jgi:DNA polymerase III epsilon subunit-like protein
MIIFDTETTGLIANSAIAPTRQPHIIDICCLKLDDETFEERGIFHSGLINPGVHIEDDATKRHGYTDERVKGQPTFAWFYKDLVDFFFGERIMVAHNCAFDRDMLYYELLRIGYALKFPWPPTHHCTVELTEHIKGHRLNLGDLHEYLFGEKFKGAHDAATDVRALARCYVELRKREIIKL